MVQRMNQEFLLKSHLVIPSLSSDLFSRYPEISHYVRNDKKHMKTPRVLILLANGFEEMEAITIIDVLRRAGVEVVTAGLQAGPIEASRKTRHLPDTTLDQVAHQIFDAVVLPGGQPGTDHLRKDTRVGECILRHMRDGKQIAAICAAPLVLHDLGVLAGKHATSYPSVREQLNGVHYSEERVVLDGKILTSRGPGTALEFALKLVELLRGPGVVQKLAQEMVVNL